MPGRRPYRPGRASGSSRRTRSSWRPGRRRPSSRPSRPRSRSSGSAASRCSGRNRCHSALARRGCCPARDTAPPGRARSPQGTAAGRQKPRYSDMVVPCLRVVGRLRHPVPWFHSLDSCGRRKAAGCMTTPGNPQDYTQPGPIPSPSQPGYGQQDDPQGPRGGSDDQTWAMLSYILALFASIIAPLVIYLVKMNSSRYVRFHAAQALNMGITAIIESIAIFIVGIILAVVLHGFGFLLMLLAFLALGIAHLVYLIMGAVRSNQGQLFRVPTIICFRMVK